MTPITEQSIGLDGEVFSERRDQTRRRVLKGATVSFNKGYSTFECVVRNQSNEGARLDFGETSALPSRFMISISGEPAREAEVRWRDMTQVGVAYA